MSTTNNTIEQLKAEALSEAAIAEPDTKPESTEIIAQVTTFEDLQKQFEANQQASIKEKMQIALNSNDFAAIQQLLSESKQTINKQIFDLPTYFLYTVNGESYLIKVPEKVSAPKVSTGTGTRNVTFVNPFKSGDKLQLKHGDIVSETYEFTLAGLLDSKGNVHKASQLVGAFMEHQLNKKVMKLANGSYNAQGISSPYWTKL